MTLIEKCREVRLILSDVDGVLTDGGILFDNQGIETKRFHIRDGLGVKLWQSLGNRLGLVTARNSHIVMARAAELGISIIRQGVEDKLKAAREIARQFGHEPREVCYVGDDLPDIPAIRWAGLGAAVADASCEVREAADLVTVKAGGAGALREIVEAILRAQGRWDEVLRRYTPAG